MKKYYLMLFPFMLLLTGCKKEPNYSNFKILKVSISSMPINNWDLLDGPDVFFNVETGSSTVLFNGSSSRIIDVTQSALPLSWNFVKAYEITNLNVTQYVAVYDHDLLINEWVGSVGFTMSEYKGSYPTSITKQSGSLTVTINGEWY